MRRLFYQDDVYLYNHDAQQLYKQQQHDCHATRSGVGDDDGDGDDFDRDFDDFAGYDDDNDDDKRWWVQVMR